MSNDALTALNPKIWELKNLDTLHLENNKLTTLPAQIGELKKLTYLDLSGNQLNTLPAQIGDLKNLANLNLYRNETIDIKNLFATLKKHPKKIRLSIGFRSNTDPKVLDVLISQPKTLMPHILELKNLAALHLHNSTLPQGEIEAIQKALPACIITETRVE
jgi:internalin A